MKENLYRTFYIGLGSILIALLAQLFVSNFFRLFKYRKIPRIQNHSAVIPRKRHVSISCLLSTQLYYQKSGS
jgi:hypothetical protein